MDKMKVILLQQKPTKETIWHKLRELFAIRRTCKEITERRTARSGQKLGWLKLPIFFCLLATTSFAGPWHCNDCITVTFTGITFDGSPYGYYGSVNQEINLPLDVANSRPHYCSYHTPWPNHLPFPFPGPSVAHDHGVWRVFYNLYYSVDSPQCPGCYTAVGILQGFSTYHVIFNTQYPANGGQAEINACQ